MSLEFSQELEAPIITPTQLSHRHRRGGAASQISVRLYGAGEG